MVHSNVFHIFFCLSNVFFFTQTFALVYHTRRMRFFAFNGKLWFYLLQTYNWSMPRIGQCLEFLNRFFGSIFVFFTVCISTKTHSYTRTSNILPSFNVLIFFCQFEPQVFLFGLLFIHVLINCNFYTWQLLHTWPVEKAGSFPFHKRQKEILKEFP